MERTSEVYFEFGSAPFSFRALRSREGALEWLASEELNETEEER